MTDGGTRTIHIGSAPQKLTLRKYSLSTEAGQSASFERRLIFIGSAPDNHFVLEDPTVSRVHCRLEVDESGHRLRDLDSKNGTRVNGIRTTQAWLPSECTLQIGETEVSFRLEDDSVEVALHTSNRFGNLLGESLQMREVFALLARVAPSTATVLIEGESGTGKELVAQAIHEHSTRSRGPFVVFDCSAVPKDLVESELFGHVKGAFTGATTDRTGAFEEAHAGTLFLDEIGELPMDMQPKLLRVLESREVKPVGGNRRVKVDVRILAATNRTLEEEVKQSGFREDLYYRLAVIKLQLPPLRNRPEDIPMLVNHFVKSLTSQLPQGTPHFQISYETMAKLQKYAWPGNIRELKNFIERAVLLADGSRIDTRFIGGSSPQVQSHDPAAQAQAHAQAVPGENTHTGAIAVDYRLPFKDAKDRLVEQFERVYWTRLLNKAGGNISEAARQGGIHRKSLEYTIKKLELANE